MLWDLHCLHCQRKALAINKEKRREEGIKQAAVSMFDYKSLSNDITTYVHMVQLSWIAPVDKPVE